MPIIKGLVEGSEGRREVALVATPDGRLVTETAPDEDGVPELLAAILAELRTTNAFLAAVASSHAP